MPNAPTGIILGVDGQNPVSNTNPLPVLVSAGSITIGKVQIEGVNGTNIAAVDGLGNLTVIGQGPVAPGAAQSGSLLVGGVYTSAGITLTNGQQAAFQFDSTGHLLTSSTFTGTLSVGAFATAAAPSYSEGTENAFSQDLTGDLRTIAKIATAQTLATVTTVGAVTAITNALPAGTNVIGHVITDSGSTTAATQTTAANLNATVVGTGTFLVQAAQSGTWTVTGAGGTFPVTQSTSPWIVAGSGTAGSAATGVVTVQGIASMTPLLNNPGTAANWGIGATAAAVPVNANYLGVNVAGNLVGLAPGTAGTAGTQVFSVQGIASMTPVQVSQTTAANLNATVVGTGTFATQSAITAASGSIASGAIASGAVASGAFASGSIGSGAVASGAFASGALASGSIASGAMVDLVAEQTPISPTTATATKGLLIGGQYNSTQATFTNAQQGALQISSRGELKSNIMDAAGNARGANVNSSNQLSVSIDGSSATNISTNIAQVAGATVATGHGTAAGSLRVELPTDGTGVIATVSAVTAITNALPAGTNILGKVGIDQTTAVTTNGVVFAPVSASGAGIAVVVSTALETGHVIKNAAGNLYGLTVTTTSAAGMVLIHNSPTVPGAGAVTPIDFYQVPAASTVVLGWNPPLYCSTGCSVSFTTATTPFTQTNSSTAAFSGQVV